MCVCANAWLPATKNPVISQQENYLFEHSEKNLYNKAVISDRYPPSRTNEPPTTTGGQGGFVGVIALLSLREVLLSARRGQPTKGSSFIPLKKQIINE
jgi:hypothetical protein